MPVRVYLDNMLNNVLELVRQLDLMIIGGAFQLILCFSVLFYFILFYSEDCGEEGIQYHKHVLFFFFGGQI